MKQNSSLPRVLVVGAGPSGLMLALVLRRFGVPCRLIDKAPRRPETSRALVLHARTLELLECHGWSGPFLQASHRLQGAALHHGGKPLASLDFRTLPSPFPSLYVLPQFATEQLLEAELQKLGGAVERPAELLELRPEPGQVCARVQDPEGIIREIRYDYVIGCDGAHSTVRHSLNLDFQGAAYPDFFGLADVTVRGPLSEKELSLFYHREGVLAFFPFGQGKFRIVAKLGGSSAEEGVSLEELQEVVQERSRLDLRLENPTWITGFRTHHRLVERVQKGRCFLVGDAAHIHSPAGGQGLNTGLQDAINLGWKLACVLLGHSPANLLESYQAERRPVAREVLTNTDRMLMLATTANPILQNLRDRFLPELSQLPGLEAQILAELSQIAVQYRSSPLTLDTRIFWPGRPGLRAGDRLPDAELVAPGGERARLFEVVRPPGFHLFLLPGPGQTHGPRSVQAAKKLAEDFRADFGAWLHVHWIVAPPESLRYRETLPPHWVDAGGALANLFGLQFGGMLLVRPDYYVALAAGDFDSGQARLSTLQYWT